MGTRIRPEVQATVENFIAKKLQEEAEIINPAMVTAIAELIKAINKD